MLDYSQLDPQEQTSVKLKSNLNFFIQENTFENVVCEMTARGRWVKNMDRLCQILYLFFHYDNIAAHITPIWGFMGGR